MSLTSKVVPYKRGFGPFAPEVYRAPAPYEYRGVSTDDAIDGAARSCFKADVDPESVACVVLEPVQGEGGFVADAATTSRARLQELCAAHGILYVDDEVQAGVGRTGPVWAIEHYGVEPDLLVSGKSLGGGLPLAAVTGPRRADGRRPCRRPRRHVRRQPGRLRGGRRRARHGRDAGVPRRAPRRSAHDPRRGSTRSPPSIDGVGEVRGLGPMLAIELSATRAERRARRVAAAARERGLLLLSCGLYGNVIRLLPPLTIGDEDSTEGLDVLEARCARPRPPEHDPAVPVAADGPARSLRG